MMSRKATPLNITSNLQYLIIDQMLAHSFKLLNWTIQIQAGSRQINLVTVNKLTFPMKLWQLSIQFAIVFSWPILKTHYLSKHYLKFCFQMPFVFCVSLYFLFLIDKRFSSYVHILNQFILQKLFCFYCLVVWFQLHLLSQQFYRSIQFTHDIKISEDRHDIKYFPCKKFWKKKENSLLHT